MLTSRLMGMIYGSLHDSNSLWPRIKGHDLRRCRGTDQKEFSQEGPIGIQNECGVAGIVKWGQVEELNKAR